MDLIILEGLTKVFGGLVAVDHLDMRIPKGVIHGLIGPNGSGKTTTFNVMFGVHSPTSGKVIYMDQDITGLPPHKIAALGITRTFQQVSLFKTMTVLDTILVGLHLHCHRGFVGALLHTKNFRVEEKKCKEKAIEALTIVGMVDKLNHIATDLPYGQQRLIEIARAIVTKPNFLLLDEPVAGMNPSEISEVQSLICRLRDMGYTILLVEHNMDLVMDICDTITVLSHGAKIAEGLPDEVRDNPIVIENYLGRGIDDVTA